MHYLTSDLTYIVLFAFVLVLYCLILISRWKELRIRTNLARKHTENNHCSRYFFLKQFAKIGMVSCSVSICITLYVGYVNEFTSYTENILRFIVTTIPCVLYILSGNATSNFDIESKDNKFLQVIINFEKQFIKSILKKERSEKCTFAMNKLREILNNDDHVHVLINKLTDEFYINYIRDSSSNVSTLKIFAGEALDAYKEKKDTFPGKMNYFFNTLLEIDDCRIDDICEELTYDNWKNQNTYYSNPLVVEPAEQKKHG